MISFRKVIVVGAIAASAALAGCGGSSEPAAPVETETAADGKTIFTDSCGSCHTFKAAGTNGSSGPDLTSVALSEAEVSEQVINGGGGMPAFEGDLSDEEISAVSQFVAENDGSN